MPTPEVAVSPTLADLSRAASTLSTSSSDEASVFSPPARPLRAFHAPSRSPARSPARVAAHITKDLVVPDVGVDQSTPTNSPMKARSRSRNPALSADDFTFGDALGEGSFSSVVVGTLKRTGQQFAIKEISKDHIMKHKKESTVMAEKNAIIKLAPHPGIIRIHSTFQDIYNLYFVLDLAKNGELYRLIKKLGSLSLACSRFYAAQLVDSLIHMHSRNVIHRDLKPENMLLTEHFRIMICDFGTSKILESPDDRTKTMNVGTAQYVSPEYLETGQTSRSSDLWSLGCTIYQMISGKFAFNELSDYLTFQKIKKLDYSFPEGFDPEAKDLVEKLLTRDPLERLGAGPRGSSNDMKALKAHPFFKDIPWDQIWTMPVPPRESGLLKREQPLHGGRDASAWNNFVSNWDESHEGDGPYPTDGIPWDTSGQLPSTNGHRPVDSKESSPIDEEKKSGSPPPSTVSPVPSRPHKGQPFTRSSTLESTLSSLDQTIQRLSIGSSEDERGRRQMVTPVQGHGSSNVHASDLQPLLIGDEKVLFHSPVELRSLRRRASLLLSRSLPPVTAKTRELVLTDQRLVLVKKSRKRPQGPVVKQEYFLRARDCHGKDKSGVLVSAETKGDRDIVLITANKSHMYSVEDLRMAAQWVRKINNAKSTSDSRT